MRPGVGTGAQGDHQVRLIRGVPVVFPASKQPFSPQLALMSQAVSALSTGRCALLESPTGTGKTLALLCSVLSWQEHDYNTGGAVLSKAASSSGGADGASSTSNSGDNSGGGSSSNTAEGSKKSGGTHNRKRRRVFFMSRTHSQLTQVVREMKSFRALGATMTIMGSRQQYCINPDLLLVQQQQSNNSRRSRSEDCKKLLATSGCTFHNSSSNASLRNALPPRVWDIEDLVSAGKERRKCPYFAARAMVADSDLVFGPCVLRVALRGRQRCCIACRCCAWS
jgi:Rad3-related DNA helicase